MQLEFAERDGRLIHISEVDRGLQCACICPSCKGELIARKGKVKSHHFAHVNSDCQHGIETALHIMAKEILEDEKKILLPKVEIKIGHKISIISEDCIVEFDDIWLEKRLDLIIPDILISCQDTLLIIEIRFSAKVDS